MFRSGLPILERELTAHGANRRSYWIRFFYVAALSYVFLCLVHRSVFTHSAANPLAMFTAAADNGFFLFRFLIITQYLAMLMIVPVSMISTLGGEKERDSFSLLLATGLTPRRVVLETYFGKMIPVLNLQLVTFPLAAMFYAIGGLSMGRILWWMTFLIVMTLFTGAVSIFYAVYCQRISAALFLTYSILSFYHMILFRFFAGRPLTIPVLAAFTILCLIAAIRSMGAVPMGHPSRRDENTLFASLDRALRRLLEASFRIKTSPAALVPDDKPILWFSIRKGAMGSHMTWVRWQVVLAIAYVALSLGLTMVGTVGDTQKSRILTLLVSLNWFTAMIYLASMSAESLRSEKESGNLELMLTTPRPAHDVIGQKLAYLRRMAHVFLLPVTTLLIMKCVLFNPSSWTWTLAFIVILNLYALMIVHLSFLIVNVGRGGFDKVSFVVAAVALAQLFPFAATVLGVDDNGLVHYLGKLVTPVDSSVILYLFGYRVDTDLTAAFGLSLITVTIRLYLYSVVCFFALRKCYDEADTMLKKNSSEKRSTFGASFLIFFLMVLFLAVTDYVNVVFFILFGSVAVIAVIWFFKGVDLTTTSRRETRGGQSVKGKRIVSPRKRRDVKLLKIKKIVNPDPSLDEPD